MANNTMSLAEFAAASATSTITVDQVQDVLEASFLDILRPLYQTGWIISQVDATPVRKDPNGNVIDVMDDQTKQDIKDIAIRIVNSISDALGNSAVDTSFKFAAKGTVDAADKTTFQTGFCLRSSPTRCCDINGTRVSSKIPVTASFNLNFSYSVKVINGASGTTVGFGYQLGVESLVVRAGMTSSAWNRLSQISSVQRGLGDNFGCQYQTYLFSRVTSFALGYFVETFDFPNNAIPQSPLTCTNTVSSWQVTEQEGANG